MKKVFYSLIFSYLIIISAYPKMILDKSQGKIKIFFSQTDVTGIDALIKGKVISYSAREELDTNDLIGRIEDKSKATVRLYTNEGIQENNTLFVINNKNLVVSKMKVRTILKSRSLGYLLVGYGNFRLASIGNRVVQLYSGDNTKYSYVHKARGDYYQEINKPADAIKEYKRAIELDNGNPDAYLELGYLLMKQGLDQFAFKELYTGHKHINRLYDRNDKYRLYKGLAEIRYREVYYISNLPSRIRNKYRSEGIKYCKEALNVNPNSADVNYLAGYFHYKWHKPSDKTARDYFLKVIELNPDHTESYIALARLYFKHKMRKKAGMFAEKALKSEPGNKEAKKLLKYIENNY